MDNEFSIQDIAKQLGSMGGKSTREKYGSEHFKRISKLGLESRRAKAKIKKEQKNICC